MPNRILRDWTDSETMDQLDVHTERFFTRLIMKADDFGRYSANLKLLKSNLFPLKSDIRETDITRWLSACQQSGLIVTYNIASKDYLQISNFKQVLRQKVEKYPAPIISESSASHLISTCLSSASLKGNEVEEENEDEVSQATSSIQDFFSIEQKESFKTFQKWIIDNAPRVAKMKEPFTIQQYLSLSKKGFDAFKIRQLIADMHNWSDLHKKRVSAYLTLINWERREKT